MAEKIKFDNNTELWLFLELERRKDINGDIKILGKWVKAKGDINLGSIKEPNNYYTDPELGKRRIIEMRYKTKEKHNDSLRTWFDNLGF